MQTTPRFVLPGVPIIHEIGMARIGLGVLLAVFALSQAAFGHADLATQTVIALGSVAVLIVLGVAQATGRAERLTQPIIVVDAAVALVVMWAYVDDPQTLLVVPILAVQAEGALLLRTRGALVLWFATSVGYAVAVGSQIGGAQTHAMTAFRVALGLTLVLTIRWLIRRLSDAHALLSREAEFLDMLLRSFRGDALLLDDEGRIRFSTFATPTMAAEPHTLSSALFAAEVPGAVIHEFEGLLEHSLETREPCLSLIEVPERHTIYELSLEPLSSGMACSLTDATHRLRIQGLFRQVVDITPDPIIALNDEGLVTVANRRAEQLFGYPPAEMLGRPIETLVPVADQGGDKAPRGGRLLDGKEHMPEEILDLVARRKDGSRFPVDVSLAPVEGIPEVHVVAALRDLTARQRAESMTRQKQVAEEANRQKTQFLSRMSHELRTPLNAVLGFAQLLEMDEQDPQRLESLREIVTGGRHLLSVLEDVLDISRIEQGKVRLDISPVKPHEVVQEALEMIMPMAQERDITIRLESENCGWIVFADRTKLRQVLLNLLTNAVKYNRDSGSVIISCKALEGRLYIRITDTGPGIPKERQQEIFEPFQRLTPEDADVGGTGLGLAVVQSLVAAMSGELKVESSAGAGSTFSVGFPLQEAGNRS